MTRLEIMIARPRQGRIPELWRKQYYSANLRSTVPRITIHAYMKRELLDKQLTIQLAELSDYLPYYFFAIATHAACSSLWIFQHQIFSSSPGR
jgi:hypothetical protein